LSFVIRHQPFTRALLHRNIQPKHEALQGFLLRPQPPGRRSDRLLPGFASLFAPALSRAGMAGAMNSVVYVAGLIVIVMAILSLPLFHKEAAGPTSSVRAPSPVRVLTKSIHFAEKNARQGDGSRMFLSQKSDQILRKML
jgi:hypothetical protein